MEHIMKFLSHLILPLFILNFLSVLITGKMEASPNANGTLEQPHIVPHTSIKIDIDGKLEEQAWREALAIDLPYETWPGENITAPVRTEARLLYSQSHLYIGFQAYDPQPTSIRANYTERDGIWEDDFVVLFLDTFNDERRAFVVRSNPLGVQSDNITLASLEETISWDAIYESAGQITDCGYSVEMAIPFNQLRFQRSDGDQVWGMNVRRLYPRSVYSHLDAVAFDRNNDSKLAQFIKIRGFEGATPGRNIELVPTLTGVHTDARSELPHGDFHTMNDDIEAGLTARWGLTANLNLNGTLNPDFSQVEADALLLDINEPFALEYEEKRPFFTEGSDYFGTLKNVFYTRTIREPLWGMKLSGKEKSHTIGAYILSDDLTNLIFPGGQSSASTSLQIDNTSGVFRYKKDIGSKYTLGLLMTTREGEHYFNRLAGVDGNFRLTKSDRIIFQALGSSTQYPVATADEFQQPQGKFDDHFIAFEYDHESRNWSWWFAYDDVGADFRADLGFIPRVDFRNVDGGIKYAWLGKPGAWWNYFQLNTEMNYYEDQNGNMLRKNGSLRLNYQGIMRSHAHFQSNISEEFYNGRNFDLVNFSSCFGLYLHNNIWFHTHVLFGDRIDYTNTRPGSRFRIDPELILTPGKHLCLELQHTFEQMSVNDTRLYTAHITQLSAIYHFNVRTLLRSIFQYVNYDYNSANYTIAIEPEYKHFFTQLLFSYKINPFTVFFLGYADNYYGNQNYGLTQSDRTIFMKLSYAWVL